MNAPPGGHAPATDPAITGTRNTNAETKRRPNGRTSPKKAIASRVIRAMRGAGLTPHGWQVRSLVATLVANREEPTDEQIVAELMRAEWFPKPRVRRHGVGDLGWRTTS
jgi:hypothetical protein